MRVLHFLSHGIFPMPGGLEQSVLRIARHAAQPGRCESVIYTRRQARGFVAPHPAHGPVQVVHLGQNKAFLMEPLGVTERPTETAPGTFQSESFRIDGLLLAAAIRAKMDQTPEAVHILISFYATIDGFMAQQAAFKLGIGHIASVQGSDFSRDFFSPYHIQALRYVVENASLTVTNNREQAALLSSAFPSARGFRVIHNAIEAGSSDRRWVRAPRVSWRLAADCGFSFLKGTHILLRAVADLYRQGAPVSLTVAGGDARRETRYWEACRTEYNASCPGVFHFPGPLTSDQVDDLLLSSDLYVSASLGEGCSLSHIRAMVLGVPMLATRTGALPELCDAVPHVRLCDPADVGALSSKIPGMMTGLREGTLEVDTDLVDKWRAHFSPSRERGEWEEVFASFHKL